MIGPGMREILSKNFVLTFLVHFLFAVVVSSLLPTLPLYFAGLKFDNTEIGILIGAFGIASLLLRPISGIALQRYTYKCVIAWGCGSLALTIIALLLVKSFWLLFLIRVFQGTAFALVTTASFALIVDITPPEKEDRASPISFSRPISPWSLLRPLACSSSTDFHLTHFFSRCYLFLLLRSSRFGR
jgi:MFS family permease